MFELQHNCAHFSCQQGQGAKILQTRLQQYILWKIPDVQANLEKVEEPEAKLQLSIGSQKKQGKKHLLIDYTKAFECADHIKLQKILKEMGISDLLTCLLTHLDANKEAKVITQHGTTDWFKIGKRIYQGCILSPCLFNLYAEYIM